LLAQEAIAQLKAHDLALIGKDSPAILYCYARWQLVTLGIVIGPRMGAVRGIVGVHFMSPGRARGLVAEWLPYSRLLEFEQVGASFRNELSCKALPTAEGYRPLLRAGLVEVVGGFTTDTLQRLPCTSNTEELLIGAIERMMRAGTAGPFLHFERSHQVLRRLRV